MGKVNFEEPEYSPTHDFDKTPIVEGELLKYSTVAIRGKEVSFLVLRTDAGDETVWLGSVLKSNMEDHKPEVGAYIGIKYLGMKTGAAGFEYRDFAVRVLHQE